MKKTSKTLPIIGMVLVIVAYIIFFATDLICDAQFNLETGKFRDSGVLQGLLFWLIVLIADFLLLLYFRQNGELSKKNIVLCIGIAVTGFFLSFASTHFSLSAAYRSWYKDLTSGMPDWYAASIDPSGRLKALLPQKATAERISGAIYLALTILLAGGTFAVEKFAFQPVGKASLPAPSGVGSRAAALNPSAKPEGPGGETVSCPYCRQITPKGAFCAFCGGTLTLPVKHTEPAVPVYSKTGSPGLSRPSDDDL